MQSRAAGELRGSSRGALAPPRAASVDSSTLRQSDVKKQQQQQTLASSCGPCLAVHTGATHFTPVVAK